MSHCSGFSRCGARALGHAGSVAVVHGLSCSAACGIFPDQGSNLCLLHWQADSLLLSHQGSPRRALKEKGQTLNLLLNEEIEDEESDLLKVT